MTQSKRKEPKKPGASVKDRRREQLSQIQAALPHLEAARLAIQDTRATASMLESVSLGLYEELDKLTKKAPAEEVTELVLEQVNEIIRHAREITPHDPYMERLREFVPAGDLPQQRDVLVVLRQVRQGLERLGPKSQADADRLGSLAKQGRTVEFALEYYLQFNTTPTRQAAKANGVTPSDRWFESTYEDATFQFDRLDRMSVPEYFSVD